MNVMSQHFMLFVAWLKNKNNNNIDIINKTKIFFYELKEKTSAYTQKFTSEGIDRPTHTHTHTQINSAKTMNGHGNIGLLNKITMEETNGNMIAM